MDPNTLLSLMLVAYISPITYVYYKYSIADTTRSISSIITSQEPLFTHENDTADGGGTMPAIIPNETLHRHVYVYYGGIHPRIRISAMCLTPHMVVFIHRRGSPYRDIRCDIHPGTKFNALHFRGNRILRDSRVYDRAYILRH